MEQKEILTLSEIKAHLRIDTDDEDNLLLLYRDGAIGGIENHIHRKLHAELPNGGDIANLEVTPNIKIAILLYLGDLYKNRENSINTNFTAQLPLGVKFLIEPYTLFYG